MVLRYFIRNYFIENREATIKGNSIADLIKGDSETIEEYVENIIMNYEQDERELLIIIASIVLRMEIDILVYNIEFDNPVKLYKLILIL